MAKSKKPLKAALQSQQSRMKMKQKASQAAQTAELMTKKHTKGKLSVAAKGKGKEIVPPRHPTIPFRPTDNILLIGEGNFSFARALVSDAPTQLEHLPPKNITATSYDTEQECYDKYPEAVEIVQGLKAAGVKVLFGIDATQLSKVAAFKGKKWDRIVWNFPHAGMRYKFSRVYSSVYHASFYRERHHRPGSEYTLEPTAYSWVPSFCGWIPRKWVYPRDFFSEEAETTG
jgi:25S rRNA (uracil2634-N3)-methyltransferase